MSSRCSTEFHLRRNRRAIREISLSRQPRQSSPARLPSPVKRWPLPNATSFSPAIGATSKNAKANCIPFFYGDKRHVVMRAKEALTERPHGHLLRSGNALWPEENVLGSTVYAAGIFNAQVFLGNTNLARFLSVVRNALNVMRASGQRVFVRIDGQWRQLGVPSAFDIGLRDARWIYRLGKHVIEVQTWCWSDRPAATLELRASGTPLEFLVTHHLALGIDEQSMPGEISIDTTTGAISCLPATASLMHQHMPGIGLAIVTNDASKIAGASAAPRCWAMASLLRRWLPFRRRLCRISRSH